MFALLRLSSVLALLSVPVWIGGGCAPAVSGGGDLAGIAPGGVQDVALARNDIQRGVVPNPVTLTVEGFLREHDIPLSVPSGAPEIFASLAGAWRKPFGEPAAMGELYFGLGTTRDLDSFTRQPLNLVLLIDVSASMLNSPDSTSFYPQYTYAISPFGLFPVTTISTEEPDYLTKLKLARQACYRIIDQLTPDDLITVITFNQTTSIVVDTQPAADHPALGDRVAAIKASGNTNLQIGLDAAFQAALASHSSERLDRVILLTDAQPTEGLTASSDFTSIVGTYAQQNVGLTLFGVGNDFGIELGLAISALRGGNSFFLDSPEKIDDLIPSEFKFFVTPAAYDLSLRITHDATVGIRDVFGVQDYVGSPDGAMIELPTLFFSRREGGGAIVVRLSAAQTPDFTVDRTFGSLQLSYRLPDGTELTQNTALTIPAGTAPGGEPPYFSDDAARRAAALLDVALGLHDAAELAGFGDYAGAATLLRELRTYYDEATLGLSDRVDTDSRSLSDEGDLITRFLAIVRPLSQ